MNRAIIAVAGAGKTRTVVQSMLQEPDLGRTFLLTYMTRNQLEGSTRLAKYLTSDSAFPHVMGWFSFLLNEIVRPYSRLLFEDVEVGALCTDVPDDFMYRKGTRRYFTANGNAFSERLSLLANKVIEASGGAAIRRLEKVASSVYIDEAQDLRGNDLDIVMRLMASKIDVTVVCDPRQSVVKTSRIDTKYKKYRDEHIGDFFNEMQSKGLCEVEWINETHRFIPEIAALSDAIFSGSGFPATISNVEPTGYSGLFLIRKGDVERYAIKHSATILRVDKRAGTFEGIEVANFGECKGMTRRDVVVIATAPIQQFLSKGKPLKSEAARRFYVAVTRARQSVAIAVENPIKTLEDMAQYHSPCEQFGFCVWQ